MAKKKEETVKDVKEEKDDEVKQASPDYEKQIKDLQKQISEFGEYRRNTEEFIKGASIVVNTLSSSPELTNAFQQQLGRQYPEFAGQTASQQPQQVQTQGQTNTSGNATAQVADKRIEDIAQSQREEILANFEKRYGIDSLKDEERKEVRRKVETYLNEFGWSAKTLPLTQLSSSLDKAYVGTHAEKLREEGKLEGIAQARQNQMGAMSSMSGTAPNPEHAQDLSEKQKEWVGKLGVDEEKAAKTYLTRSEEEKRVPKSEKPEE